MPSQKLIELIQKGSEEARVAYAAENKTAVAVDAATTAAGANALSQAAGVTGGAPLTAEQVAAAASVAPGAAPVLPVGELTVELVPAAAPAAAKASEIKPLSFKAAPLTILSQSRKAEMEELGVIFGIGGGANVDKDNEQLVQSHMVAAAHNFCASPERTFKANHVDKVQAHLVESALGRPILKSGTVLKAGDSLPAHDVDPVVGFDTMAEPTHWFVAIKPEDQELLAAAKAGKVSGFSWSGLLKKTEAAA